MIRSLAPFTLALGLTAGSLSALDLSEMTPAERAEFGAQVREYLLENPEVIVDAINILEQRQADAQAQADLQIVDNNADEIFDDGYSWVGGNPDGDVTLVEFMDYRCGFCRRAVPEIAKLLENDGNIRWIIKEFPILGEDSLASSRFAIAVKQVEGADAYKQAHDALVELSASANDVTLRRLSDGLVFDTAAVMDRMNSDEVTQEIAQTRALAQRLQISGTPTFVLGDELLRGFLPADQMQAIVDEKRG